MFISQLRYDGFEQIAMNLTQEVRPTAPCPPCAHLLQLTSMAKKNNTNEGEKMK